MLSEALILTGAVLLLPHDEAAHPFSHEQRGAPRQQERELLYVQAVWRHGDRAPSKKPYPDDPYDESHWPRGWNQLTNLGMQQMRELGEFFRRRYVDTGFISPQFNMKEVFVLSSDSDRALVSAQAMLSGLFPPYEAGSQFDSALRWQPIAVHSSGYGGVDPLLKVTDFHCPTYDALLEPIRLATEQRLRKTYPTLVKFLKERVFHDNRSALATFPIKRIIKLNDISREMIHGMAQPSWVHRRWPEYSNSTTLEIINEMHRRHRISEFEHHRLAYLRGGYPLGDWMQRAEKLTIDGNLTNPSKMILYSSHDGTLQALLHNLGTGHGDAVPYAACVIMEVYKRPVGDTSRYEAELFYRHDGNLSRLIVKGCDGEQDCLVGRLADVLKSRLIQGEKSLYRECGLNYCTNGRDGDTGED